MFQSIADLCEDRARFDADGLDRGVDEKRDNAGRRA
jgi:hypothetical protein